MEITTIGIDLPKNVFQVHGVNKRPAQMSMIASGPPLRKVVIYGT